MASGPARFAARCPSRLPGRVVRLAGLFGAVAAIQTVPAQELTGERLTRSELVKADLSRLSDLQRGYFEKNKTYTVDSRALNFAPTSGAQISMSYASVRSWAANATHPASVIVGHGDGVTVQTVSEAVSTPDAASAVMT